MKTISKTILAAVIISPVLILLSTNPTNAVEPTGTGNSVRPAICTQIGVLKNNNQTSLEVQIANTKNNFTQRISQITANQSSVDKQLATSRATASTQFDARITELLAKNNLTTSQKQAITLYQTNMKKAEVDRQNAVDNARSVYRKALTDVISGQQQTLTSAIATYQKTVDDAFATSVNNCGDGTAMSTLKTAVKTARQTLADTKQSTKSADAIKQLAATRDAAIKTANEAFAKTAADLSTALSTALKTTN